MLLLFPSDLIWSTNPYSWGPNFRSLLIFNPLWLECVMLLLLKHWCKDKWVHFADGNFECIFVNDNCCIWPQFNSNVLQGTQLVLSLHWFWKCPDEEPMTQGLLTNSCVCRCTCWVPNRFLSISCKPKLEKCRAVGVSSDKNVVIVYNTIYVYTHTHTYIYIYICIERERFEN